MGWWRIDLAAFAADRRPREIIARRRGFPIFLALNHAALRQRLATHQQIVRRCGISAEEIERRWRLSGGLAQGADAP